MPKKVIKNIDQLIAPLHTKRKQAEKATSFTLSEIISALMAHRVISVRKLAKLADVSPSIIQDMRSGKKLDFSMQSFFKVLKALGCEEIIVGLNGNYIPFSLGHVKINSEPLSKPIP